MQTQEEIAAERASATAEANCVLNPVCYLAQWAKDTWTSFLAGILGIFSFFPWVTGSMLDFVIKMTIIDMTKNVNAMSAINSAWATLRDLANILFIFILLYTAIATVLRLQGANTKKILTRVIVIALLINFSFFFTRVIIDVSNALSVGFYNAIITSGGGTHSFASAYMDKLNIETFYNVNTDGAPAVDLAKYPIVAFMGALFFLVTSFVFLAAVGLFVSRYVVLIFLMILSAPAFAAMALPNDKYSSKWWDALWSQVLFAPIYFILSWVTLQILDNLLGSLVGGDGSLAKAITGSVDAAGNKTADPSAGAVFANFGIVIAFMIASLTIAKSLAGTAGKGISNFVGGVVGGATLGSLAWVGRRTLGREGYKLSEDKGAQAIAKRKDFAGQAMRLTLQGAEKVSKSSFDMRNIKTLGIGGVVSRDLGSGEGTGGYRAIKDRAREDELKDDKMRVDAVKAGIVSAGTAPVATPGNITILHQQIDKMVIGDIEKTDPRTVQNSNFAAGLSHAQMEAVQKSEKFTETEKSQIKTAREAGLINIWTTQGAGAAGGTSGLFAVSKRGKPGDMSELPKAILTDPNFAEHLTVPALQRITNEGTLSTADRIVVRNNIAIAAMAPGSAAKQTLQKANQWLNSVPGSSF